MKRWFSEYTGDDAWTPEKGISARLRRELSAICTQFWLFQCDKMAFQGTDYFLAHKVPLMEGCEIVSHRILFAKIKDFTWCVTRAANSDSVQFHLTIAVYENNPYAKKRGRNIPGSLICDTSLTISFPYDYPCSRPLLIPLRDPSWISLEWLLSNSICAMNTTGWQPKDHDVLRAIGVYVAWVAHNHAKPGDCFNTKGERAS